MMLYQEQPEINFAVVLRSLARKCAGRFDARIQTVEFDGNVLNDSVNRFDVVVAHELAHVFWTAVGQPDHNRRSHQSKAVTAEEFRTESIAINWAQEILAIEMGKRVGFEYDEFFMLFQTKLAQPVTAEDTVDSVCKEYDTHWAAHFFPDEQTVAVAKEKFLEQHSQYFSVALQGKNVDSWSSLEQVKEIIQDGSNDSVE